MSIITSRLTDKAESNPGLLRAHLSEDDAADATIAAFIMLQHRHDSDVYRDAQDTVQRIFDRCCEEYIAANDASERSELMAEMADAAADAKIDDYQMVGR